MSDKSPLFVSAAELLAHATELYTQGNERKYKFVILHLANAVELILKDCLIDKGISIYIPKKPQTIGIWDSFEKLQKVGVDVLERPVIELLIDDRNTIQHRFGFPDAETVYFYLLQVVAFFERFLDEEYDVNVTDVLKLYLTDEDLAILGLVEKEEDKYAFLDRLLELSPESAVLQAYKFLENRFMQLIPVDPSYQGSFRTFWKAPDFPHLLDDLVIDGYISQDALDKFQMVRDLRNRAAHAFLNDSAIVDWAVALDAAKDLLVGLDKAIEEEYFTIRATRKSAQREMDADSQLSESSQDTEPQFNIAA